MADLTPRPDSGGEQTRGQVILVAAFAIAVTLVALALVLNAAIYTEHLATRTESSGATDALTYRTSVQQNVGAILAHENDVNAGNYPHLRDNVSEAVGVYSNVSAGQEASRSAIVAISYDRAVDGARVHQRATDNFTDASNEGNWTVASGVEGAREFRINVSDATGGEFRVNATSGSDEWWMNVTEGAGGVTVGVDNGTTRATCTRSSASGPFWINVTEGTVAGTDCPALTFAEGVSDGAYDVGFENGSEIEGRYSLIVNASAPPSGAGDFDSSDAEPTAEAVLYAVFVETIYKTPELDYETTVRVAPGESDA